MYTRKKFYIAEGDVLSVLSAQACKYLNLVQWVNSVIDSSIITDARADILLQYSDHFHGLGCLPGKHKIRIDPTVVPVVYPPRKVPVSLKGRIKDELIVKPNKLQFCLDRYMRQLENINSRLESE